MAHGVADVVEADGLGELREEHGDQVGERREKARLGVHTRLPRGEIHDRARNLIDNPLVVGKCAADRWRGHSPPSSGGEAKKSG